MFRNMPRYSVERSIDFDAPQEKVWEYLISFDNQAKWSPWMIIEPKAKRKITGKDGEVGTIDSWDGEIIGAGERENMDIVDNDYLDQQIFFKRPFKSSARSYFSLQRTGDSKSTLTWGME